MTDQFACLTASAELTGSPFTEQIRNETYARNNIIAECKQCRLMCKICVGLTKERIKNIGFKLSFSDFDSFNPPCLLQYAHSSHFVICFRTPVLEAYKLRDLYQINIMCFNTYLP